MGAFLSKMVDVPLSKALNNVYEDGTFDDTIFFLISDHGLHFGEHLESIEGQVEHKLPLFIAIVPDWWAKENPQAMEALVYNQQALVTAYDIHRTIKDIFAMPFRTPELLEWPAGLSMLDPLDLSRDCEAAGIQDGLCVCENNGWKELPTSSTQDHATIASAVSFALDTVTGWANDHPPCSTKLTLDALEQVLAKDLLKGKYKQGRHLKLQFTVNPKSKNATQASLFEASIWERGTGTFQYKAALTGERDLLYIHRLSGATEEEIKVGGAKAEFCIIP